MSGNEGYEINNDRQQSSNSKNSQNFNNITGNIDELMNEIDTQNISNLDSFSLIQKDPDIFDDTEYKNGLTEDNKIFSFEKKGATRNDENINLNMAGFDTFNNSKNTASIRSSESNKNISNNNNGEMVIDYSKFEKKKPLLFSETERIGKRPNNNLDMFLISKDSRKELSTEESKMSLLEQSKKDLLEDRQNFDEKKKIILEESRRFTLSKNTGAINTEQSEEGLQIQPQGRETKLKSYLEEIDNQFEKSSISHNHYRNRTTSKEKDPSPQKMTYEGQLLEKTQKYERINSPTLNRFVNKNSKGSYASIVQNKTMTTKRNRNRSAKSIENVKRKIKPMNLVNPNSNYYYFNETNSSTNTLNTLSSISKQEPLKRNFNNRFQIPKVIRNKAIVKRKTSLESKGVNREKTKRNKTNDKVNEKVTDLLDSIKVTYQKEEQKYIEKEQDLLSEIQILREKINTFSLNETNYQIEIEKLKRKKNNNQSVIDEQQTSSITNNTKLSDISISRIEEFPKDLNTLLLKNGSAEKKNTNSFFNSMNYSKNNISTSQHCSNKYKSHLKLFNKFGLTKSLFIDPKEESELIDDTNEIDYDMIFTKYPQLKSFIQIIADRFNKECTSRLQLEEKTLKIFSNDIKTIDNLEKKLKKYESKDRRKRLKLNLNSSQTGNSSQGSIKSCDIFE